MLGTKAKPSTDNKFPSSASSNGARDASTGDTCVISSGTIIEGKFSATENVRLDGLIKGEVKCSQRLVMGESGRIEGNIRTKDAIIMGKIEGEIFVEGTLHLKGSCLIRGAIHAKFMVVDEGARYVGECKIGS